MTTNSPGAETPVQAMPVDPVGIRPIPSIPAALRGCWDAVPNEDPDEPGGGPMRLIIGATTIQQSFGKGEAITATADFIEQVSARSVHGRFSAPDKSGGMTVATSLQLGPDETLGIPADELRVAEGDAGSYFLKRCH